MKFFKKILRITSCRRESFQSHMLHFVGVWILNEYPFECVCVCACERAWEREREREITCTVSSELRRIFRKATTAQVQLCLYRKVTITVDNKSYGNVKGYKHHHSWKTYGVSKATTPKTWKLNTNTECIEVNKLSRRKYTNITKWKKRVTL